MDRERLQREMRATGAGQEGRHAEEIEQNMGEKSGQREPRPPEGDGGEDSADADAATDSVGADQGMPAATFDRTTDTGMSPGTGMPGGAHRNW